MSSVDIVRAFYGAVGHGDVPAAVGLLAPELEWTEAERFPYFAGTWRTPEAVVDGLLSRLNRDWLDFSKPPSRWLRDWPCFGRELDRTSPNKTQRGALCWRLK